MNDALKLWTTIDLEQGLYIRLFFTYIPLILSKHIVRWDLNLLLRFVRLLSWLRQIDALLLKILVILMYIYGHSMQVLTKELLCKRTVLANW